MTATPAARTGRVYKIKALHLAERLKLKDVREAFRNEDIRDFTNYEFVIGLGQDSYLFVYNYGSVVFFNVPDDAQERILARFSGFRTSSDIGRTRDDFLLEVIDAGPDEKMVPRVYFDRVVINGMRFQAVRTVCMLIAESTGLEYYEILVENLLEKTNTISKQLEARGRIPGRAVDLVKFIGMCMNMKQEIISNLYIVDSPEEAWDDVEIDKLYQEVKIMVEIDIRYRALDYKIRTIQESIEIIVDLAHSRRANLLDLIIILLIGVEIVLSIIHYA